MMQQQQEFLCACATIWNRYLKNNLAAELSLPFVVWLTSIQHGFEKKWGWWVEVSKHGILCLQLPAMKVPG